MKRRRIIFWIGVALFALVIAALSPLALLTGCSKSSPAPSSTSRVYTAAEVRAAVPLAFAGDTAYAEVRSAWLREYYSEFRAEVFRQGVTKWDERFDCNHFATYYVALAQTKFYLAAFHSPTPAQSLAVGTFWYQSPRGPHAIVVALTERGAVYIEPQTGAELQLTPEQRASAWLRVF